jgi:hypothetical protein
MTEKWYTGGVYNQKDYGYTFNLKTGKSLRAADAIGGTSKQIKSKVLSGAKTYFKKQYKNDFSETWSRASKAIGGYNTEKYKFYLVPGKIYICFESYELGLANDYQSIPVTSKYK